MNRENVFSAELLFTTLSRITARHVADLEADPTLAARLDNDPALRDEHVTKLMRNVAPFGLCPYCHDAFCVDGKNACVDCETLLGEEAK